MLSVVALGVLGYSARNSVLAVFGCNLFLWVAVLTGIISNTQFMMRSASEELRGVVGGLQIAFTGVGGALGITLIDMFQAMYVRGHWNGEVPVDATCATDLF